MSSPPSPALGELETAVLDVLWSSPTALSVREVLTHVRRRPPLAYTTVLTVLDRLHGKGVVVREKEGKAYHYSPRVTREAWFGERAARALAGAAPGRDEAVLLAFLDSTERVDPQLLDKLSALIAARRGGTAK
ncbi:MAG: BlaI/MecI/CopY family transcriptional regulator [Verrucomicrobiae bacterium]|nr:BlaI/MecI/CopY family transcriptional regulator [Polyangiaceae bacterium]NUN94156.1 BlaI/MecI/CopY family transcriptional regulator [Verrucomicrobiae bacterium]